MRLVPVTHVVAKRFVGQHHRHNQPSLAAVFVVGLKTDEDTLIGVAVAGLPKARLLMDGRTLEVTRVCVLPNQPNANSMLYGACARAAAALGYQRLVTYTLPEESGASLKATGWVRDEALVGGNTERWENHPGEGSRPAVDLFGARRNPPGPKVRWWKFLTPLATKASGPKE